MSDRVEQTTLPWTPRQLIGAAALLCLGVLAMWSAWSDWYGLSTQIEEHSHVFLVVPFGAVIMYVNRERFAQIRQTKPSWVGPLIVAGGFALAYEGFNHAHESFWHMGAVLVALGAAVTVLGHGVLIKFWPAFLMLGFMVPMPNTLRLKLAFPLQTAMATLVEHLLGWFGEPVGRQGNSLTINGKHVLIVEACNGLRMVFTLILVSWLFAFVAPLKTWVRVLILVLSPLTAMFCNAIRLVPTLLMYGHASDKAADVFHDVAGWGMTLVALLLLFGVMNLLEWLGIDVRADDGDGDGRSGGGGGGSGSAPVAAAVS
jgi:exosortase